MRDTIRSLQTNVLSTRSMYYYNGKAVISIRREAYGEGEL